MGTNCQTPHLFRHELEQRGPPHRVPTQHGATPPFRGRILLIIAILLLERSLFLRVLGITITSLH